jgi:hypothetical protein
MSIEAMKQWREVLERAAELLTRVGLCFKGIDKTITSIDQAIAEAEKQEPVAYDIRCDNCGGDGYDPKDSNYFCSSCEGAGFLEKLFYTHPQPKREPLTEEQARALFGEFYNMAVIRNVEAAHGIKENT